MQNPMTIDDFSKHLFWDKDLNSFDFAKLKVHLKNKVLECGLINV
jgi:hypothetical protein